MLVLSRKIGEEIVIGDNIRITVVEIRGGKVRIGIVAPKEVIVDRGEIHEKHKNPSAEWAEPEIWAYSCQETS
jgi:carbon storage regulator